MPPSQQCAALLVERAVSVRSVRHFPNGFQAVIGQSENVEFVDHELGAGQRRPACSAE